MINTIIFDLGGVLIDWNPKYLFEKIFDSKEEMEHFLNEICTPDWNEEQDAGRSIEEATNLLVQQHPEHANNIRAFYGRWPEMLGGVLEGTVTIFNKLKQKGIYKILALTNWSAETYPIAQQQFEFLNRFDGVVVSGTEKLRKPYTQFYQILLDRYQVQPNEALFIDDNLRNIKAAQAMGIDSIHFTTPEALVNELAMRGIILD